MLLLLQICKRDFILSHSDNNQVDVVEAFNSSSRSLDDLLNIDSPYFAQMQVSKGAKIRNRYNQAPHLTQDTNGKVTNSQLDTTNERQEASRGPQGTYKQTRTKS